MNFAPLPENVQELVADLKLLKWDVACHLVDHGCVYPKINPDKKHRRHHLVVDRCLYENANDKEFLAIWFYVIGHLVLGETRDPVFSDERHLTTQITAKYGWPVDAVTTIWAMDQFISALKGLDPLKLWSFMTVVACMLGDTIYSYEGLLQRATSKDNRLGFHAALAKNYGLYVRASQAFGIEDYIALARKGFRDRLTLVAGDCDLESLAQFFCNLEPLSINPASACNQLENTVADLITRLKLPFQLKLERKKERCWWAVVE